MRRPAGTWLLCLGILALASPVRADDWLFWRGPLQNGVSAETNLPATFSIDPAAPNNNLVWKVPVGARTTPIVVDNHVYLINGVGKDQTQQERVMCLDADTGKTLWEHHFNVFFSDIVTSRLGWTNIVADPETGNIYAHGTQGFLMAFTRDGKLLWEHSLTEEYGRVSGYGGRITSPVLDGDLLIMGMVNSSWGEQARGGNRFVAFDKKTGAVVWWSDSVGLPKDTYYSVPIVADLGGERLVLSGTAEGSIVALKARTGQLVWKYTYGTGAVNCSPVVKGNLVYIGHGEENPDNNFQGRVICLDAGHVMNGKPRLVWQVDKIKDKFTSPIIHGDRLYVTDEIARLYCLDANTGKQIWRHKYGREASGSPLLADGKIYVPAVNAQFQILKPGDRDCEVLYTQEFPSPDGVSEVELSGSASAANGRVYFSTSFETYCIGKKGPRQASGPAVGTIAAAGAGKPALVQVVPADVVLDPGGSVQFKARLFDEHGNWLRDVKPRWSVAAMLPPPPVPGAPTTPAAGGTPPPAPPALNGKITDDGTLTVDEKLAGQFGGVVAEFAGLTGRARVRVAPRVPYAVDFSKVPIGRTPGGWVNTQGKFAVAEKDGKKVLMKTTSNPSPLVSRANAFMGRPSTSGYSVEADVLGLRKGIDQPDVAVVVNRYTLMLTGNNQTLRLVSWDALPRIDKTVSFEWKPDVWYHMKLVVDVQGNRAVCKGKVWQRGTPEPSQWTVTVEDPVANKEGSPAIYAYSPDPGTEAYFDNVKVIPNNK